MKFPQLEKALQEFATAPDFKELNIGPLQNIQLLKEFERPYSVQGVFRLEGQIASIEIYVKIFKNWRKKPEQQFKEELATEFRTIQFWYQQLQEFSEFTTFRPLYFSSNYDCIITENTPGENLAELVQKQAKGWPNPHEFEKLKKHLSRSGQLLKTFQNKTKQNKVYDYQTLVEDVDIRLRQLINIPKSALQPTDREAILAFYQQSLKKNLPAYNEVILHRDFGLGNLLVTDQQVIVHDFNRLESGHPFFDLTRLFHQLEMLTYKPVFRRNVIKSLQEAYLEGYGYQDKPHNVLFNLFLLRHYFTHLLGLVKTEEKRFTSRLYSQWVKTKHLQNIKRIISEHN